MPCYLSFSAGKSSLVIVEIVSLACSQIVIVGICCKVATALVSTTTSIKYSRNMIEIYLSYRPCPAVIPPMLVGSTVYEGSWEATYYDKRQV